MKRSILITGGAGFIGSHTCDALLQQGHSIVVIDNLFSGKLAHLNLNHPQLEFIQGDVLDENLLQQVVERVDAVLHLAAIASVDYSLQYPVHCMQINTQGFVHILEAIRKTQRDVRLVYASSAAVYGESLELPHRDTVVLTSPPLSPYALQKNNVEEYAALYQRLYGIQSLGLRYFNVYGLRQDPHSPYAGVISRFIDAYRNDQAVTVYGEGLQSRDFIHVHDIACANQLALAGDYAGVLNIGTGRACNLLELIHTIELIGQKKVNVSFAPKRSGEILNSYADIALAKTQLSFRAQYSLADGLKTMMG